MADGARNYYNEIDPHAAQWVRNLIAAGHIAPGDVDERSIEDVRPDDLRGYVQCHFFAGIAGWAYALDLAGWPRDRPVWTGSCPCQPFSAAGKGDGFEDERHLWPAWQHLIAQRRPPVVFGEQVASKTAEPWIDLVHADLEGMGYAFGCVPFPASGVGAPHIRDRNYWMAHAGEHGLQGRLSGRQGAERGDQPGPAGCGGAVVRSAESAGGRIGRLADANGRNASAEREQRSGQQRQQPQDGGAGWVADTYGNGCSERGSSPAPAGHRGAAWSARGDDRNGSAGPTNGQWRTADWLACRDGKWRPVEPGTFPLAHGIPGRVGRLRAYGNAIVPQQAAEFVAAYIEARTQASALSTPPAREAAASVGLGRVVG